MKTIYDKGYFVQKLLGEQIINYKEEYRLMNYVIVEKIQNDTVLYNNLTKRIVTLSDEEVETINKKIVKPNSQILDLISNWFLVPISFNEQKVCDQIFEVYKLYDKDDIYINNYIILTTTDCNARCYYCYEHGVKKQHMSVKTAIDVADYIIKKSKGKKISIKWFGGEPLYNSHVIDIICDKLASSHIEYITRMTTNGYLFTDEIILLSKSHWNLKNVQITLDGTEQRYNKIKSYIYNDNISPFKIVIDNIEKLLKSNINVNIRINISKENKEEIYNLIDYIKMRFPIKNGLSISLANIFDLEHKMTVKDLEEMMEEYFKLIKYTERMELKNYKIDDYSLFSKGCMAQNAKSVVISPNGLLGKCEHFSEGEKMFGSIYTDKINFDMINYWEKSYRIETCKTCVVYPNCYGITNCPVLSSRCELVEKPIKEYNIHKSVIKKYYEYIKG